MSPANTFYRLINDPKSEQSLSSNRVLDIVEGDKGNFWVATHGGGLNRYLTRYGLFERFRKSEREGKQRKVCIWPT